MSNELKKCGKCNELLSLSAFYKDARSSTKRSSWCKQCASKRHMKHYDENKESIKIKRKAYYHDNKDRIRDRTKELHKQNPDKRRKHHYKQMYNLTIDQYAHMLHLQENKCAICGCVDQATKGNRLVVDHNHETGKVRALLCSTCNTGIGMLKESEQLLLNALSYLRKFNQKD